MSVSYDQSLLSTSSANHLSSIGTHDVFSIYYTLDMGREDVAIFWDLDTCPVHGTISGYETVERIRLLSHKLGNVKSFRGYADLAGFGSFSGSPQLRSELQSSGVSLIDCPTTEQKSIASKTMIVDIFTHAIDNPPPTTLIVIAGNSDVSYAVSILQLRRYDVVLVCPKDRVGQYSQASLYLDWFEDILGCSPPMAGDSPQSSGEARPRPNTSSNTSLPPRASLSHNRTTPSPVGVNHSALPKHVSNPSTLHTSFENTAHLQETINDWNDHDDLLPIEVVPPNSMAPGVPDADNKNEMERIRIQSLTPEIPLDIQRPSSAPPSYSSFSPAPSPSTEDLCAHLASRPFCMPESFDDQSFSEFMNRTNSSFDQIISQVQSPADTSTNTITPRDFSIEEPRAPLPRPFTPSTERISIQIIAPFQTTQSASTSQRLPTSKTASPPSTIFHPPAPDIIPDHFMPLVRKLQLCRAQGQVRPLRPGVAAEIVSSYKDEMEKVEASTFLQYAQLAEHAGIVELSLPGDKPWISLRPELHEYNLD